MNIITRLKRRQRHASTKASAGARANSLAIPTAQIAGITTLPTELWGTILDYLVAEELGHAPCQSGDLPIVLRHRLVCRVFSKEISHALRQHITLPQIPHLAVMRALFRNKPVQDDPNNLITTLLASAICNSSSATIRRRSSARVVTPLMVHRIRNCTIIASHLSNLDEPRYATFPEVGRKSLMLAFCSAASTSTYCQEYMYMPWNYWQWFSTYAQGDACLEVGLLGACGYSTEDALRVIPRLKKEGKLAPYSSAGLTGHGKCGKRRDLRPRRIHDEYDLSTCMTSEIAMDRAAVVNDLCERGKREYYRRVRAEVVN